MYKFLLNMYLLGKITEAEVRSYVGKYLTQAQADKIITSKEQKNG